jgi:hypothetical protein
VAELTGCWWDRLFEAIRIKSVLGNLGCQSINGPASVVLNCFITLAKGKARDESGRAKKSEATLSLP